LSVAAGLCTAALLAACGEPASGELPEVRLSLLAGTVQVRVSLWTWGFKSPLAHSDQGNPLAVAASHGRHLEGSVSIESRHPAEGGGTSSRANTPVWGARGRARGIEDYCLQARQGRADTPAMAPWMWKLAALAGAAAGVAFLAATTSIVREAVWLGTLSLVLLATLVAVSKSQPGRRYPWVLISGCIGLFVLANLLGNPLWATPATAAWSIPIAVVAFPLLGFGALALSRSQVPGGDRESAIDGGIVVVAMAAVLAATVYQPGLLGQGLPVSSRVLYAVVAPLTMSAVLAASIRLLFTGGVRLLSAWFVVGAVSVGLVGNAFRSALLANGSYERGTPSDLLILGTYILIGLASLHPSAVLLTQPADPRRRQLTVARLAVLGVALIAIPLTLLARGSMRR